MTKFFKIMIIICTLLCICACGKATLDTPDTTSDQTTTALFLTTTAPYVSTTPETYVITTEPETTIIYSEIQVPTAEETLPETTETQPVPTVTETFEETSIVSIPETLPTTTEKVYEKTGEMAFSDSGDNKYIKAISTKYGVNDKNLVALYTVPDNNGNLVLEFDGSTDAQGKLIRNENTLIAIYSIDKNLNSKRASETTSLNEYSYGEMKVMFLSTTKYIMPEFEEELKG